MESFLRKEPSLDLSGTERFSSSVCGKITPTLSWVFKLMIDGLLVPPDKKIAPPSGI